MILQEFYEFIANRRSIRQFQQDPVSRDKIARILSAGRWAPSAHNAQPWRFFEVLHGCGALAQLVPPLAVAMGPSVAHADGVDSPPIAALKRAARRTGDGATRLAAALCPCLDSADQAG